MHDRNSGIQSEKVIETKTKYSDYAPQEVQKTTSALNTAAGLVDEQNEDSPASASK